VLPRTCMRALHRLHCNVLTLLMAHFFSHPHSLSLSVFRTICLLFLSHSHSHSHYLSLSHTHSHSISLSLSHTHTHTPFLSSPPSVGHFTDIFDVVFMDLHMPVMDGIEATKRYREYERYVHINNSLNLIV
jgi:CheY-like chemotaxis protein